MRRKFVTNLILLVFLNLLIKPFWIFGIDRTVQNIVGAEEYGFYFSLLNFSMLLNILLDAGITNFNNRNIAQNNQLLSKHFSNILSLKLLLGIGYFAFSLLIGFFIGYEWRQFKLLIFLLFNQFLLLLILYMRSNISGLHLFRTDSLISVLDRTLMVLICGVILWGNVTEQRFQIEWFVYIQTLSYLITGVVTFFMLLPRLNYLKLRFNPHFFLVILKQSFPFALLAMLMAFYFRLDSVLLERLLPDGKEQAGIYAHSFRILDAASMFSYLFAALLLPIFSKMIKEKVPVNELSKLSFLLLMIPALILVSVSVFYNREIIALLYTSHVERSAEIFAVLIVAFLPIASNYIFGTLLTAKGSLKALNMIAATTMLANVVLNLILIPHYQAYGAAIASLSCQTLAAVTQFFLAKKYFGFQPNMKLIFSLLAYVILIVGLGFFAVSYIENWLYGAALLTAGGIVAAFALRILNLKSIYLILRYKEIE